MTSTTKLIDPEKWLTMKGISSQCRLLQVPRRGRIRVAVGASLRWRDGIRFISALKGPDKKAGMGTNDEAFVRPLRGRSPWIRTPTIGLRLWLLTLFPFGETLSERSHK